MINRVPFLIAERNVARSRLSQSLAAVREQLSPQMLAQRAKQDIQGKAHQVVVTSQQTVKSHSRLFVALLAGGAFLMFMRKRRVKRVKHQLEIHNGK